LPILGLSATTIGRIGDHFSSMKDVLTALQNAGPDGLTVVEISEALSLPERTVRDRVARLMKAKQAKRPLPRGPIYAADVKPRKRVSAPRPKPQASPSRPAELTRFEMALETMERHPEGVANLAGLGAMGIEALVMFAIRVSSRFRAFLQGQAANWPVTERMMLLDQRASASQAAAAWGQFYDKATAEMLRVELAEMRGILDEETLYEISEWAQKQDPPNVNAMKLAVDELNRRAAEERKAKEREAQRQRARRGVPAQMQPPDLRVVTHETSPTNAGQLITIPVANLDVYRSPAPVSQRETLERALGVRVTGPLWPEDDPDKGSRREALANAQSDQRAGIAVLRPALRPRPAPATPLSLASRRREIRGRQQLILQAALRSRRQADEQARIDRQLADKVSMQRQTILDRVDELKRALRHPVLTGRLLSHQERAELEAELGELLAEAAGRVAG
jgi:DNA-binding Lrp family transcriptional regulator